MIELQGSKVTKRTSEHKEAFTAEIILLEEEKVTFGRKSVESEMTQVSDIDR